MLEIILSAKFIFIFFLKLTTSVNNIFSISFKDGFNWMTLRSMDSSLSMTMEVERIEVLQGVLNDNNLFWNNESPESLMESLLELLNTCVKPVN